MQKSGRRIACTVAALVALAGALACPSDRTAERGMSVVADPEAVEAYAKGKAWAVVIGIDAYEHAPHLNYAVADARAVSEEFEREGFEVTTLLNDQATRGAILREIGDRLPARVSAEDRVVVFFAGHGQDREREGGQRTGFLLPVEAVLERMSETAIPMGEVRSLAAELPAKHVLFLIDACYGGIAGTLGRSASTTTDAAYLRSITRERGRQLITAGGPSEVAYESPEWGHSAFTHVLLKGLREGLADQNHDGLVPARELHQYLERGVFDAVRDVHSAGEGVDDTPAQEQRPQFWELGSDRGEFVFFVEPRGGASASADLGQQAAPAASSPDLAPILDRWAAPFRDSLEASLPDAAALDAMEAAFREELARELAAVAAGREPTEEEQKEAVWRAGQIVQGRLAQMIAARTNEDEGEAAGTSEREREFARIKADIEKLEPMQAAVSRQLDEMHAQSQNAIRHIRSDDDAGPVAPSSPPKDWTCNGNKVVINGKQLSTLELVSLMALQNGSAVPPGCYWYDAASGMWGREGEPAAGDMQTGLNLGGPLRADASNGDSRISLNGRDLTRLEAQRLAGFGAALRPGRYWMNAQGVGGPEGAGATFSISAAMAAARANQGTGQGGGNGSSGDSYYQSGDAHGGVQGDCVYMSGSDFSYIGDGCD